MKKSSLRSGLAGIALLSAAVLGGTVASPAAAAPEGAGIDVYVVPEARATAVEAYWTPERMRAAIPADVLASDNRALTDRKDIIKGEPVISGSPQAASTEIISPTAVREAPVATIGKVFFTLGGADYVCSGNVVSAPNRSTVSTAGHCVNEGGGAYASRWTFVPAYENGRAPYGQWSAVSFASPSQWTASGDISYDAAFVRIAPRNGATLQQTVGATPVAFNQARGLVYEAFGYPAAAPFTGETLQSCYGRATADPFGQSLSQGIPCDMTGGSSGGPWFLGSGAQNSVNSFGYNTVANRMFGPYFGSVVQGAYTAAANG
jgi:hypothetical protein